MCQWRHNRLVYLDVQPGEPLREHGREYLKIVDPDNANQQTAHQFVKKFKRNHRDNELKQYERLARIPGDKHARNRAFERMMLQYHQSQVGILVEHALEVNGNQPALLRPMMH
ncbi:hypothetical protein CCYS_04350 [Corynebacterium cystitidis DSM 20524]|uniref:Uncharacterized protein n=1 Tax=Corynebacterium cystitidis DSM 20524 TaxID=1121357 RepID=A0A1H9WCM8_9CORY|nr:hypothetical protein CCYS_04350 [Corynebacterium cystitidis DSM 20524]SES31541.1 hypothetical protein SAMN05661109_02657 [Corynebacterium cystitidis DSM 20524]SNV83246.1 Uncharacterised protein [Corynebacterium cystitidis]